MSTNLWIVLALAVVLALGYLLVMRVFLQRSRDLDKQIDYTKIRPWKDDEGKN